MKEKCRRQKMTAPMMEVLLGTTLRNKLVSVGTIDTIASITCLRSRRRSSFQEFKIFLDVSSFDEVPAVILPVKGGLGRRLVETVQEGPWLCLVRR